MLNVLCAMSALILGDSIVLPELPPPTDCEVQATVQRILEEHLHSLAPQMMAQLSPEDLRKMREAERQRTGEFWKSGKRYGSPAVSALRRKPGNLILGIMTDSSTAVAPDLPPQEVFDKLGDFIDQSKSLSSRCENEYRLRHASAILQWNKINGDSDALKKAHQDHQAHIAANVAALQRLTATYESKRAEFVEYEQIYLSTHNSYLSSPKFGQEARRRLDSYRTTGVWEPTAPTWLRDRGETFSLLGGRDSASGRLVQTGSSPGSEALGAWSERTFVPLQKSLIVEKSQLDLRAASNKDEAAEYRQQEERLSAALRQLKLDYEKMRADLQGIRFLIDAVTDFRARAATPAGRYRILTDLSREVIEYDRKTHPVEYKNRSDVFVGSPQSPHKEKEMRKTFDNSESVLKSESPIREESPFRK